jgi:uncharacterized ion transporter superfamily protein YfcC
MAIIAAAGVPYEKWIKFVLPLWAVLMVLGAGAVAIAMGVM